MSLRLLLSDRHGLGNRNSLGADRESFVSDMIDCGSRGVGAGSSNLAFALSPGFTCHCPHGDRASIDFHRKPYRHRIASI